jgi:hypothetical protein
VSAPWSKTGFTDVLNYLILVFNVSPMFISSWNAVLAWSSFDYISLRTPVRVFYAANVCEVVYFAQRLVVLQYGDCFYP